MFIGGSVVGRQSGGWEGRGPLTAMRSRFVTEGVKAGTKFRRRCLLLLRCTPAGAALHAADHGTGAAGFFALQYELLCRPALCECEYCVLPGAPLRYL